MSNYLHVRLLKIELEFYKFNKKLYLSTTSILRKNNQVQAHQKYAVEVLINRCNFVAFHHLDLSYKF